MVYEIDHFPGTQLYINGVPYRYFGGTSYLGLQTDTAFQELFIANIKKYGTNYGASRNSNIRLAVFEQAETHLASIVGSEACLTLSSGYLAGQFVARQFNQQGYDCFYAPNTHAALFSQNVTCFRNYDDLNTSLRKRATENPSSIPVVFLDAVDFSGTNYPSFEGLKQLPLGDIILVVDDSHGIGIIGHDGGGVFKSLFKLKPKELLVCASLGKGYGIQAGAIFGSRQRLLRFTKTDFFGGASPATPAAMGTLLQAKDIYREKRKTLRGNISLFQKKVEDLAPFAYMKDHPAFSFSDLELINFLIDNRVLVTSFQYPNDEASVMSRIVIGAGHTVDDILALAKMVNSYHSTKSIFHI